MRSVRFRKTNDFSQGRTAKRKEEQKLDQHFFFLAFKIVLFMLF